MYLSTIIFSLYNQPQGKIPKEETKAVSEAAIKNVQSLSSTLQVQNYNQPQIGTATETASPEANTAVAEPLKKKIKVVSSIYLVVEIKKERKTKLS